LVNHANEVLSAYKYPEGVGKKGGNNFVSLIYKYLFDNGIITLAETHGPGKEFTIIFDNGAGQNENRMVIRFGQYLVDKGIFKKVEIIFLITGHTKNICDRRFKDLKYNFYTRYVYTFYSLIDVMKEGKAGEESNRYLDVHAIKSDAFFNWDAFEDRFYKKRIPGISKYHYFGFTDKALQ
jgi:hypothetical protein